MSRKFTYTQYLERIQRRASVNAKRSFRKTLRRRHLRSEVIGVTLLITAVVTYFAGLRISTAMCLILAVPILSMEFWYGRIERQMGLDKDEAQDIQGP